MGRKKTPEPENEWEQLPNESPEAYEAFALYRDMAYRTENAKGEIVLTDYVASKRSTRTVCQELAKSRPLISRWCMKYLWVERAQAYDRYIDRKALAKATRDRITERENQMRIWGKMEIEAYKALTQLFDEKADEVKRDPKILLAMLEKSSKILDDRHEAKEESERARQKPTDSADTPSRNPEEEQENDAEPSEETSVFALNRLTDEELNQLERIVGKYTAAHSE